jgi:hypothetical protein
MGSTCSGKENVFRIAFGHSLFFAFMALLTAFVKDKNSYRLNIHTGFWFIKFGTWTSLLVASFYLDFDDIQRFGDVTRFGAGLFLAIQMILILDLIYTVNEKLLDQENPAWQGVMITLTGVLYAFSFAGTGVAYWYYVKQHSGCGLNIFFITMNLFLGLVNTVLSLLPKRNERAGLLTAGMTFGYTTWLLISGLAAENGSMLQECHRGDASQGWITASGFILSMAVVIYGVVGVTSRSHKLIISQNESIDEEDKLPYRPDLFHVVFLLASMNIAMVLSSWTLEGTPGMFEADRGEISVWVKMVLSWASALLYSWTVIAPVVLKSRDFEVVV